MMSSRIALLVVLYVQLGACEQAITAVTTPPFSSTSVKGRPPHSALAAADTPDGEPLSITVLGDQKVALQGFKLNRKRGLSSAQCGVLVEQQRLITIGDEQTDVYTCGKLIAAGRVAPHAGNLRVGLIYEVSSPNAAFRTAVILEKVQGRWLVDPKSAGVFDDLPAGRSIPALRQALAERERQAHE